MAELHQEQTKGRGAAMLAATAIAWGSRFPIMKLLLTRLDPFTLTLARIGLAAPVLLLILAIKEGRPALIYPALIASAMGFLFWNAGLKSLGAARGVLFINLVPITAFAIALTQGHIPAMGEVAGVIMVIGALILNSSAALKRP